MAENVNNQAYSAFCNPALDARRLGHPSLPTSAGKGISSGDSCQTLLLHNNVAPLPAKFAGRGGGGFSRKFHRSLQSLNKSTT